MIFVATLAVLASLAAGLVVRVLCRFDRPATFSMRETAGVSRAEFLVVSVLMALVIMPSIFQIGTKLSVDEIVRYEQFVNGVETRAVQASKQCYEGHSGSSRSAGQSNCTHTYVSGSYTWQEQHSREVCTTSGSGKDAKTSCRTEYYYTTEWANIYTPYVTIEYTYSIESSMGKGGAPAPYQFPTVYAAEQPQPFRGNVPVPASVPRGAPADWLDAKAHLDAGKPRPVTMLSSYDNYILASGDEVLMTYAGAIEQYKSQGLLPDPAKNIMTDPVYGPSHSQSDKLAFVGINPPSAGDLQRALMQFNAALGMKLTGDLHVVMVNAANVPASSAVEYTTALKAYWQSPVFDKRAIAKNSVIVVLGVTDDKVEWAQGTTGMPYGNETMLQWIQDWLPGKSLDANMLFGSPVTVIKPGIAPADFTANDYTVTLSTPRGALEEIMFEKAPFKRARMSCDDGNCVGYKDLLSKIEPTTTQKTWMVIITTLVSLILWLIVAYTRFVDSIAVTVANKLGHNGKPQDEPVANRRRGYTTTNWR